MVVGLVDVICEQRLMMFCGRCAEIETVVLDLDLIDTWVNRSQREMPTDSVWNLSGITSDSDNTDDGGDHN